MTIILKRGKDNKDNIKLGFTEILDLTQYAEVKDRPQMIYNLIGVVAHIG